MVLNKIISIMNKIPNERLLISLYSTIVYIGLYFLLYISLVLLNFNLTTHIVKINIPLVVLLGTFIVIMNKELENRKLHGATVNKLNILYGLLVPFFITVMLELQGL